jgi:hypothetical protein
MSRTGFLLLRFLHQQKRRRAKSDSYTPERSLTNMNSIEQVNLFTRAQERVDAAELRP